MNLIAGERISTDRLGPVLDTLPGRLLATLQKPPPDPLMVVEACDGLAAGLADDEVLPILEELGMGAAQAAAQLAALRLMFSRPYLAERLETELGAGYGKPAARRPYGLGGGVTEQLYPLGVLLHIAAGNMDGLPVYSVIEGLLAGNINLLKLPSVDGGLSVLLLERLFSIQPRLAEYVYVFELSSSETDSILRLAELSNAIVVWGGDEAVRSVRAIAPPNVGVIEWGHKLSFAYATKRGATRARLEGLARHVCATNGLLCSSCQGVFVNSESMADVTVFCEAFLPVLERVAAEYPPVPLSATAQTTLQLYSRQLERAFGDTARIYRGRGVSLTAESAGGLGLSLQFRNLWVRPLPAAQVVETLHGHKGHLQTAALLCAPTEWENLRDKLWRAGIVRVSPPDIMSDSYCGAAHDGMHPLRRYTRLVSAQQ